MNWNPFSDGLFYVCAGSAKQDYAWSKRSSEHEICFSNDLITKIDIRRSKHYFRFLFFQDKVLFNRCLFMFCISRLYQQ
jgi:hypothetical protein